MKEENEVKDFCHLCGKTYYAGKHSRLCYECRQRIRRENAKKINLSELGHEARRKNKNAK